LEEAKPGQTQNSAGGEVLLRSERWCAVEWAKELTCRDSCDDVERTGNGGLKSQAVSSPGLQLNLAEHSIAFLKVGGRLGAVRYYAVTLPLALPSKLQHLLRNAG